MKRAENINELANNLITNRLPSPVDDENIYVPVYEKLLSKLRDKLQHTEDLPTQTLFITGQPRTGKFPPPTAHLISIWNISCLKKSTPAQSKTEPLHSATLG